MYECEVCDMANKKADAMVPIYGNLIVKGQKVISEVPEVIREDVSQWLIDNGHEELADEEL